jgi:hypothetical protein
MNQVRPAIPLPIQQSVRGRRLNPPAIRLDQRFNPLAPRLDQRFNPLTPRLDQRFNPLAPRLDQRFNPLAPRQPSLPRVILPSLHRNHLSKKNRHKAPRLPLLEPPRFLSHELQPSFRHSHRLAARQPRVDRLFQAVHLQEIWNFDLILHLQTWSVSRWTIQQYTQSSILLQVQCRFHPIMFLL